MSQQMSVILPEKLSDRIEEKSEKTGLTKSEIARDGILKKLRELES